MNRLLRVLLTAALLSLCLPALADRSLADPPDPGQTAVVAPEEQAAPPDAPRWGLDAELQASRDAFQSELAALTKRFAVATDQEQALAIQRQISTLKVNAELAVLEIQARRARERGDETVALQLEEMVAQVRAATQTPAPALPATGPVPATAPGR